jgi:hypothetical protein
LNDGVQLLVQAKDRAAGAGRFGLADLRAAFEHAMEALRLDPRARFVVITDAELTAGLAETGFERSVAEALPDAAARLLEASDRTQAAELKSALERSHLVRLEWLYVHEGIRRRIEASYALPPAVAGLAYASLLEELSTAASEQRHRQRERAVRLRPSDLDALVQRLLGIVSDVVQNSSAASWVNLLTASTRVLLIALTTALRLSTGCSRMELQAGVTSWRFPRKGRAVSCHSRTR